MHEKRVETQLPKPDMTKTIPQGIKAETCDTNTSTDESESSHSTRYPKRERRPPQYYRDYKCEVKCDDDDKALTSIDYCYRVACDVPQTLKEAMSSSKSELWAEDMKEEVDSERE